MLAKISLALSIVLTIAVCYLLVKSPGKNSGSSDVPEVKVAEAFKGESGARPTVLAFINGDTLNEKYAFIVEKSAHLNEKLKAAEQRVKAAYGSKQQEYNEWMKFAQTNPDMSEKDAAMMNESLGKLEADMAEIEEREMGGLKRKEAELQEELAKRVNTFLEKYSKERGIDYVINHQHGDNLMLYGSSAYDVTAEVLAGLNAEYSTEKASEKE